MLQGVDLSWLAGQPRPGLDRRVFLLGYLAPVLSKDISDPGKYPRWRSGRSPASARRRRRRTDSDPRGRGLRPRVGPADSGFPVRWERCSTLARTHNRNGRGGVGRKPRFTRIDDRESRNRDVRGRRATSSPAANAKAKAAIRAGRARYFVDHSTYSAGHRVGAGDGLFPVTQASRERRRCSARSCSPRHSWAAARGRGSPFADITGRKKATLVAVAGFGATLLIAVLPAIPSIGALVDSSA